MTEKLKAVVLNDNMGPYHFYRLECANHLLDSHAIQFSSKDHTNLWDNSNFDKEKVLTLFSEKPITEIPKNIIKKETFLALNKLDPQIVILSGWDAIPSLYALQWAIKNQKPTVIISESQEFDFKRNMLKEFIKKIILKLIDAAFVGGINQADYLVKLGFDRKKIFDGCDIVDNEYFYHPIKNEKDMQESNLPEKFFMTSCRFVEKKNLFFLLEAFQRFYKRNKEWKLVLVGDGPLKKRLEEFSIKLDINDSVIFTGYKEYEEVKNIYHRASCFILPSLTEQWGLVVNESLASGIPVLASNRVGSAPNLIENEQVGYTFSPNDIDDLVEKMFVILEDFDKVNFKKNTHEVISKWDGRKYGKNIYKAATKAIDSWENRGAFPIFFLSLFIKILK